MAICFWRYCRDCTKNKWVSRTVKFACFCSVKKWFPLWLDPDSPDWQDIGLSWKWVKVHKSKTYLNTYSSWKQSLSSSLRWLTADPKVPESEKRCNSKKGATASILWPSEEDKPCCPTRSSHLLLSFLFSSVPPKKLSRSLRVFFFCFFLCHDINAGTFRLCWCLWWCRCSIRAANPNVHVEEVFSHHVKDRSHSDEGDSRLNWDGTCRLCFLRMTRKDKNNFT